MAGFVSYLFKEVLHLRSSSSNSNTQEDGANAAAADALKAGESRSNSTTANNPATVSSEPAQSRLSSAPTAAHSNQCATDSMRNAETSTPFKQPQQQQAATPANIQTTQTLTPNSQSLASTPQPFTPQPRQSAATVTDSSPQATSVSFISPQFRSLSTSNAVAGAGSMSAGRAAVLARKSMGAASLSPQAGADSFRLRIGICAMDKKAKSKPMKEIISRLVAFGEFEIVNFGDELILNQPISEWPKVDCLMSWYSDGFPLAKAQAYADAYHPFLINDLKWQNTLQDRRAVYRVLQENGIAVPNHIVVNRDNLEPGQQDPPGFIEEADYVELDGVRIDKPFVEKPASGEDHNIHIYYPHSMGGGVKRLFRKIDNKSSLYDPNHPGTVRRDGSYIYEEFLATGGTDVKVYTVGPRYAHAEARKSPVVDGRVLRAPDGKEMRFPVLLNPAEKEISRVVTLAFGQKVCGFDLLRSEKGRSYVCDVNGWSFVKSSRKYYDDAAGILRSTILAALAPHRLILAPAAVNPFSISLTSQQSAAVAVAAANGAYDEEGVGLLGKSASLQELSSLMGELSGVDLVEAKRTDERSHREELRCVLAVIRHGDRTPKQKLKVRVRQPALLQLFTKHADAKGKQAKLKSPVQLQELLDICRQLLQELQHPPTPGLTEEELEARDEQKEKLNIVKTVLEQGGQFSGINRKVQLKPLVWSAPAPATTAAATEQQKVQQANAVDTADDKQQQRQQEGDESKRQVQEVLLILKYGGVLTHAGRAQAEELGKVFRLVMYPRFGSGGGGLLRLHSTYRHDLKIYSSDEGRVQVSAAAFTKGLLALEGSSLTPILVSLVTKDASMLDAFGKGASEDIRRAKQILYTTMTWDPATATSNNYTPHWTSSSSRAATPALTPALMTSPPLSPRAMSRASSSGGGGGSSVAAAAAAAAGSSADLMHPTEDTTAAAANGMAAAAAAVGGSSDVKSDIPGMPENPLQHLKKLNDLMKTMVEQLRQLVLDEKRQGVAPSASSMDLVQTAAAAAAAAPRSTPGHRSSSSSSTGAPAAAAVNGQQQQQLLATMTSLANSATLAGDSPSSSAAAGIITSPPRPATAPPCTAAAAAAGSSSSGVSSKYSSLSHDPHDWCLQSGQPCSGERLLLMFDRWQKLAKSFYKKGRYDISKVPDIYDSAKYDALHNMHLGLSPTLEELYKEAKILADAVIPNEYGVDPAGKLAIGSKIATELLAKLLDDLRASKDESLATLTDAERNGLVDGAAAAAAAASSSSDASRIRDKPLGRRSVPISALSSRNAIGSSGSSKDLHALGRSKSNIAAAAAAGRSQADQGFTNPDEEVNNHDQGITNPDHDDLRDPGSDHGVGGEAEIEGFDGDEYFFDQEPEMMHRLCPMYASDINSPLRHVRTRIYFTSESHMHSLVNILRFCHLRQQLLGSSSSNAGHLGSSNSSSLLDASKTPRSSIDIAAAPEAAAAGRPSSSGISSPPHEQQQAGSSSSSPAPGPLISDDGLSLLSSTTELDYLTQLVLRLYENKSVPADHPQRFRLEILFCPGTAYNPITEPPPKCDHTFPPKPRVDLHIGEGATLADFDKLLRPFAAKRRQQQMAKDKEKDGK